MGVQMEMDPSELTAIIEALHDGILRRIRWTTVDHPSYSTWRTLPIETVQTVLDNFVSAYTKSIMVFRENDFARSDTFEGTFMLHDEVWDLVNALTVATEWDDVPTHPMHGTNDNCAVCGAIGGIA